jgi:hypothetical protein
VAVAVAGYEVGVLLARVVVAVVVFVVVIVIIGAHLKFASAPIG